MTLAPATLTTLAISHKVALRRVLFAILTLSALAGFSTGLASILNHGGWSAIKIIILAASALGMLFSFMAFWNAIIGFLLLRLSSNPAATVNPALRQTHIPLSPGKGAALALAIRHENVRRVAANVEAMWHELATTGHGAFFDIHILSDSTSAEVMAEEDVVFGELVQRLSGETKIFYRRREENTGFKAGNLREFACRVQHKYKFMITLDADSFMSGSALLRLAQVMENNPRLGILQTLAIGRPASSAFARIFQFGMRQGMRTHTMGMSWWQGDAGPYWGHNAAIRIVPYVDHCALPILSGAGPLTGHILSHDQVEAALMRGAGWEVRVIPDELGSWEENPASLPEFVRRDLRWCQGNMQYWRLLTLPNLQMMGRWQLLQAILMYLGSPLWVLATLGFLSLPFTESSQTADPYPEIMAIILFYSSIFVGLTPRLLGTIDLLLSNQMRSASGGGRIIIAGWVTETLFSFLLGPVMIIAQTLFMAGLLFGRRRTWDAQRRQAHAVSPLEATSHLWPQIIAGWGLLAVLVNKAPGALPWALPTLLSLLGCVPFAWVTTIPAMGRWMTKHKLCALPEEGLADPALERLERLLPNPQEIPPPPAVHAQRAASLG